MSTDKRLSITLTQLVVGEALPCAVFVMIDQRFITFRSAGDVVDAATYERLELKGVNTLYILASDQAKYLEFLSGQEPAPEPSSRPELQELAGAREDAQRKLFDIFQGNAHPDQVVRLGLDASRRLVTAIMKMPIAMQTLANLQTYSKGTVMHSVNVSILSIYLALQMGYSHNLILGHVALGALLHDIGKPKVPVGDSDSAETVKAKMNEHPTYGLRLLEARANDVPEEVRKIVAQHHEYHDGTGTPKRLRGNQIYDLAKIVAIANAFDELVAEGEGPLPVRQKKALAALDQVLFHKFDPEKIDKAIKILTIGL